MSSPIYVTRPSLPSIEEYADLLRQVWSSGILTHNGPMVQRLERELQAYLDVPNVVCVASGTCALQLAIRALDLTGEIITTPFSFIATANIIDWERCQPVFVDIEADTFNINPNLIEGRITPRTTAILPVHSFSRPCSVEQIRQIANTNGLRVIYDAAHAMSVDYGGQSLLRYGDASAVSFHATKLFNTAEGGAVVTDSSELAERVRCMRFFGFDKDKVVVDHGMNAKMTEIHAALGLANLAHLNAVRERRRVKYDFYRSRLADCPELGFQSFDTASYNFSYFPIVFDSEELLLRAVECLQEQSIYPRRYFYPALNHVAHFECDASLPVSERIATTILCLPLYDELDETDIRRICDIVITAIQDETATARGCG